MSSRRRGATFCVIVLLASSLLLAIGGAFVEASRSLVTLGALRERHEQAREALAGAAAWSRAAVASGQPGAAKLQLSKVSVDVTLRLAEGGDAYFMDAVAHTIDGETRARASIARRDGKWVVTRFELVDGEREKKFR